MCYKTAEELLDALTTAEEKFYLMHGELVRSCVDNSCPLVRAARIFKKAKIDRLDAVNAKKALEMPNLEGNRVLKAADAIRNEDLRKIMLEKLCKRD